MTTYDAFGRVSKVTSPTVGEDIEYFYPDDLTVVTRDAKNNETTAISDVWGRVIEVHPPSNPWLRYTYDAADRLTKVEKMTGSTPFATTTMGPYDAQGNKWAMDDMDMGQWRYRYDALANLTRQDDARGCITTLNYSDSLSRLTSKSYSGNCGTSTATVSYSYDATTPSGNKGKGKRTGMSDGSGSTAGVYGDSRGRMTKETKVITGGGTYVTQWAYDSGDQVTNITYPDNEVVTYSYLPQMVINTAVGSSTYVNATWYDEVGRIELRTLGANQIRTDYHYYDWDTQGGRLHWIKSGTLSGSSVNATLQNLTYIYDLNANISAIVDALAGGSQTQSYGYDTLDRLTSAVVTGGSGGTYNQSYSYDSYGRMLNGPQGSAYSYGDGSHKHAVTVRHGKFTAAATTIAMARRRFTCPRQPAFGFMSAITGHQLPQRKPIVGTGTLNGRRSAIM